MQQSSNMSPQIAPTKLDMPVFLTSGGLIFLFMVAALIDIDFVSRLVDIAFAFSVKYFGPFWQVLLLATFGVALGLAFSQVRACPDRWDRSARDEHIPMDCDHHVYTFGGGRGFLSWAIIGTLGSVVAMYVHYHQGLPLKPRSLLYPVLGERAMHGGSALQSIRRASWPLRLGRSGRSVSSAFS